MTGAAPAVLVVGASGGIGTATSLAYARRGARLTLAARGADDLHALALHCRALGATARVHPVDVADGPAMAACVADHLAAYGRLDVAVHTAATVAYGRVTQVPAEVFDHVLDVGVKGTANVARAVLPVLAAQPGGGSLVVVGSVLGQVTVPLMGSYVTSKWGVRGLTRVLQQEARDTPGVHVARVDPGAVDTAIYRLAGTWTGVTGRPPPPVVGPEAVARAVLRAVDGRRRQVSVGPVNPLMRLGFTLTPRLYDALVGPLMRLAGQSRTRVEPNPGNVFAPSQVSRAR